MHKRNPRELGINVSYNHVGGMEGKQGEIACPHLPLKDVNNSNLSIKKCQQEGWEEGIVKEFGMDICTLLYFPWTTNKDLLYRNSEFLQYSRGPRSVLHATWGGGVWMRMDPCVCIPESLCCPPETTTTLLIGYPSVQNEKFSLKT